jgi:hypothetical protein
VTIWRNANAAHDYPLEFTPNRATLVRIVFMAHRFTRIGSGTDPRQLVAGDNLVSVDAYFYRHQSLALANHYA